MANPRISSELEALPPGKLWWISRCALLPDVIITFSDDATPTWIYAKNHANILWRLYIVELYKQRLLQDPMQLERETQEALCQVKTELWIKGVS